MDILEAKELVIKAGHELLESGLIARTWGNVSCRVNDKQFVITPSGMAYETLTPDEIVLVNIEDLSYEGDIKPSSEKAFTLPAINFAPNVISLFTHQKNASVISALGVDINAVPDKEAAIIGNDVPCASYGLPGTGKLRKGVVNAINRSKSKAIIMAHHGAVCLGKDYDEAFAVANALEDVCEEYISNRCADISGKAIKNLSEVKDYITSVFTSDEKYKPAKEFTACDSVRKGDCFYVGPEDKPASVIDIKSGAWVGGAEIPDSADMHWEIYKKRKDINYIKHSKNEFAVAASKKGKTMKPFLDDFAQLVGPTVKTAVFNPASTMKSSKKVAKALGNRNAVLVKDNGAVCVAGTQYDAEAVEIVMDKGCKTFVGTELYSEVKPINQIEAHLMRFIYLKKYSKKAGK